MIKEIQNIFIIFIFTLSVIIFSSNNVFAQDNLNVDSTAISISPLTFELTANPGEIVKNKIKIYNPSDQPVFINMEAEDFSAVGETGSVVVQEKNNKTYSLASWVSLSPTEFTLLPNERKIVDFTINIPEEGEPGGHYGSILASISPPAVSGGSGISQKVGALVLLSVAGEVNEKLIVKEFTAGKFYEKVPVDFLLRFENLGSVHARPRGFISITNMLGKKEVDIAFEQKNVLPNSIRKINVQWDPPLAIGKYTATLVANYGVTNSPLSAVTSFWVFPWKTALVILIILIIIIFILVRSRKRLRLAFKVLLKGDKTINKE